MKAVCKKLFSLMLVAILLVSAVPFQAFAEEVDETAAPATEAAVEATEAAAAAVAETVEEVVATSPVAYESVTVEKGYVNVHFQLNSEDGIVSQNYRIGDIVETKLGKTVSTPSSTKVLSVLESAIGNDSGYDFVRWYYYHKVDGKVTFANSLVLNSEMMEFESGDGTKEDPYIFNVYAEIEAGIKTITLDPNGGTVSTKKHTVQVGTTYGTYGSLPTPIRANYTFAGWERSDGVIVGDEDQVRNLRKLTATWTQNDYTVVYQGYTDAEGMDEEGWQEVGFGSFSVDANSVLKTANSNFPTTAQINSLFLSSEMKADGWYVDGWQYSADDGSTWKTFTAGSTKVTGNFIIRPVYKKSITLYANDAGKTTRTLTVTLGKVVPTLPNPGTRDGLTFMYWYYGDSAEDEDTIVADRNNLSNTSVHPKYYPGMGNFTAHWTSSTIFYLYIYTNNNTSSFTKRVIYYDAPVEGTFYFDNIDMYDIFPSYKKYDDDGDEQYGWFDSTQWDNFRLDRPYNELESIDLAADGETHDDIYEFFILLNDVSSSSSSSSSGSSYNDNKSTVDSSNPTTGDPIFAAVTVMAVSTSVLFLFFLNKKRIAK